MEWYNDKSLPLRRILGRRCFTELRRKSLKLRLEWSIIIQNFVGNLCKVNIYKLNF